jgi:hypothetical protein
LRAEERGLSLGAAVSEMMRHGLRVASQPGPSGFLVLVPPPGASVVTDALVARYDCSERPA